MNNEEKIILKDYSLPGVDKSVGDFTLWATTSVIRTEVTKKLHKERGAAYIGVKERLNDNEVIKVGKYFQKYRVIEFSQMTDKYGNIYQVKRVDGNPVTQTDIDAIRVGHNVEIVSRLPLSERAKILKTQHHIDD